MIDLNQNKRQKSDGDNDIKHIPSRTHLATYTEGENIKQKLDLSQRDEEYDDGTRPLRSHLHTYTAGEEDDRLTEMAMAFGLTECRRPRKAVRGIAANAMSELVEQVGGIFTDTTFERARLFSVGLYEGEDDVYDDFEIGRILVEDEEKMTVDEGIRKMSLDEGAGRVVEDDVHSSVSSSRGGSMAASVFGIIKTMVNASVLYVPHGFANAGYAFAIPCLLLSTLMYLYSSDKLLDCWRMEMRKKMEYAIEQSFCNTMEKNKVDKYDTMSSPYEGEKAPLLPGKTIRTRARTSSKTLSQSLMSTERRTRHLSYPELAYRAFGRVGEQIVMIGIACMQFGCCLTYFIFVPLNLHESIRVLCHRDIPMWFWVGTMVLIELPLTCLRDIKKLTYTNVLASLLIFFGLIACLFIAFTTNPDADTAISNQTGWTEKMSHLEPLNDKWFLFIGTTVYLYEGSITLCIPLQEAVEGCHARASFPSVYKKTISSIIAFYCFFGIVCWSAFGPTVETVVTTSLPPGYLAATIQLAYSIAVLFSFPLQAFPALEIVCHSLTPYIAWSEKKLPSAKRAIITSTIVVVLSFIAVAEMNNLGHIVSLMGALIGSPIAFVIPPLIHMRLVPDSPLSTKIINVVVSSFGVFAMIATLVATLCLWNDGGGE